MILGGGGDRGMTVQFEHVLEKGSVLQEDPEEQIIVASVAPPLYHHDVEK